jgi:hypothetical protein
MAEQGFHSLHNPKPYPETGGRYIHQEYPKMMYSGEKSKIVNSEDEELQASEDGFSDKPAVEAPKQRRGKQVAE